MERNVKIIALMAAFVMLAVPCMTLVDNDDSSATTANGAFNFYVYSPTANTWSEDSNVSGYNALIALKASTYYSNTDVIVDDYTYSYVYDSVTYYNVTTNYGDITTFQGKNEEDTSIWNVLAFTSDSTTNTYSWNLGSSNLGWYKSFEDYASYINEYGTANIALYYGTEANASSMITSLQSWIAADTTRATLDLTEVSGSDYTVTFYLQNNPDISIAGFTAGTYVGTGSDAFLALCDALTINGIGHVVSNYTTPAPGYLSYSWIDTIFGVGTSSDYSHYWASYLGNGTSAYCSYSFGMYSPLTDAPVTATGSDSATQSVFTLVYL